MDEPDNDAPVEPATPAVLQEPGAPTAGDSDEPPGGGGEPPTTGGLPANGTDNVLGDRTVSEPPSNAPSSTEPSADAPGETGSDSTAPGDQYSAVPASAAPNAGEVNPAIHHYARLDSAAGGPSRTRSRALLLTVVCLVIT